MANARGVFTVTDVTDGINAYGAILSYNLRIGFSSGVNSAGDWFTGTASNSQFLNIFPTDSDGNDNTAYLNSIPSGTPIRITANNINYDFIIDSMITYTNNEGTNSFSIRLNAVTPAAIASASSITVSIAYARAGADGQAGTPGTNGDPGNSFGIAQIYTRSATTPTSTPEDSAQYTFSTGDLRFQAGGTLAEIRWTVTFSGTTNVQVSTPVGDPISLPDVNGNLVDLEITFAQGSGTATDTSTQAQAAGIAGLIQSRINDIAALREVWGATSSGSDIIIRAANTGVVTVPEGLQLRTPSPVELDLSRRAPGTGDQYIGVFTNGSTGAFTATESNGWSTTIPIGSDRLWLRSFNAISTDPIITILDSQWSDPLNNQGEDGRSGAGFGIARVYQRSATQPTTAPNNVGQYTFATGVLGFDTVSVAESITWGVAGHAPGGGLDIYTVDITLPDSDGNTHRVQLDAVSSNPDTESNAGHAQAIANAIQAQINMNSAINNIWESVSNGTQIIVRREIVGDASPDPSGTIVANFGLIFTNNTGVVTQGIAPTYNTTVSNGWSTTIPTDSAYTLWVRDRALTSSETTSLIQTNEWNDVRAAEGIDSPRGINTAIVTVYQRSASTPTSVPSAVSRYNFTSGELRFLESATLEAVSWLISITGNPTSVSFSGQLRLPNALGTRETLNIPLTTVSTTNTTANGYTAEIARILNNLVNDDARFASRWEVQSSNNRLLVISEVEGDNLSSPVGELRAITDSLAFNSGTVNTDISGTVTANTENGFIGTTSNNWSTIIPTGSDRLWYRQVRVTGRNSSIDVTTNDWSNNSTVRTDQGETGIRGAGRWNVRVGTTLDSSYTDSQLNTFLAGVIPGADVDAPVNGDQIWLFASASTTNLDVTDQQVWIYNGVNWIQQTEVVDGNLLVTGTLNANDIQTGTLNTSQVTVNTGTTTGERVEIGSDGIIVYDSMNRVRVRIGNLGSS